MTVVERLHRRFYDREAGWVDATTGSAALCVAIRTFWLDADQLRFGTGAGITWGSGPQAEWAETQRKAGLLLAAASSNVG